MDVRSRVRQAGGQVEELLQRTLSRVGMSQPETTISADAQDYWSDAGGARWKANSHWRDASVFDGSDLWSRIGRRHLEMFQRGARLTGFDRPWGRVVEWGCGGGANAVHFAEAATEFVGVDVSAESLEECGRQVAAHCDTPYRPVLVEVADPERAVDEIGPCDVFLCCYVFELLPTPEYGERLLRVAQRLLKPGGLALIQVKYHDGGFWTRSRRRAYRTGVAGMTSYGIAEFWELVTKSGLRPESVQLVPKDELDERYAYFVVSRP
ncbi:class I SAM-dependent methyltransferase [Actinophytocola xanthii]|uniref:SAM-dependent methyltransferase n=1 Tax=Actinophytocola xanthii TaxID=1912961 RepID=A0A1Q8CMY3_9PSEU|nr:class I SAM-dependent methyltransferase [Actinophytocola xanthii]OLF15712.1 SAM-dependent methyltransferase [Actinophytocola xanthii]